MQHDTYFNIQELAEQYANAMMSNFDQEQSQNVDSYILETDPDMEKPLDVNAESFTPYTAIKPDDSAIFSRASTQDSFSSPDKKNPTLEEFQARISQNIVSGQVYCQYLKDVQKTLLTKQFHEVANINPLANHSITEEYRTKMLDWMVEVCLSFKCVPRTYFLAAQILDKYLSLTSGKTNMDIHTIGVMSIFLASKYEDLSPIKSETVSEKIAHGQISASEVLSLELHFLELFEYNLDFVTHFDFLLTYIDKIEKKLKVRKNDRRNKLLSKFGQIGQLITKMAIQSTYFSSNHSHSQIVLASLLSSNQICVETDQNGQRLS